VTENVIHDLGRLITLLMQSNVRMIRPSWVMAPRTQIALMTALDANSNYVFRQEMLGGTLWGWPFATTTQIPIDLTVTVTAESELYLADFADVVIGETTSLMLSASDTAAYHDGSGVVSAFSLDQNVVRAIVEHDMVVRHAESIAYLKDVDWVTVTT
jgi:HK97 family phage major capsid protein